MASVLTDLHRRNLARGSRGSAQQPETVPSHKSILEQVTPSGSRIDAALPVRLKEQSFAHLAKHADQKLYGPSAYGTCCKDANPHRLLQRCPLFTGLHPSWGYKHFTWLWQMEVTQ